MLAALEINHLLMTLALKLLDYYYLCLSYGSGVYFRIGEGEREEINKES
jgi:hypothetical protein